MIGLANLRIESKCAASPQQRCALARNRDNRAHQGKAKIKSRIIADLDPDEWDLPPKPKWMRWRTYNRYVERFDHHEAILEDGIPELLAKLGIE